MGEGGRLGLGLEWGVGGAGREGIGRETPGRVVSIIYKMQSVYGYNYLYGYCWKRCQNIFYVCIMCTHLVTGLSIRFNSQARQLYVG